MYGDLVRTHRRGRGMTQKELAVACGLAVRTIRAIEAGHVTRPRSGTVELLADAFALAGEDRERFHDAVEPDQAGQPADVPAQLPADVSAFTGRDDELARLDGLVDQHDAVAISVVSGTAGVGKTALAVRWAHRMARRFPGGQLYVNLRGYDPNQPISTGDALARFLTALGVPDADIPFDLAERAARYRTQIAGRRMLIVLDNASTIEQVRPLLPGTPPCAVVVTSRDRLDGLVARDGAQRLDVDLLPAGDAVALLRALIGPRVDAEPDAAAALAHLCARLPLALRVAAELTTNRPGAPLADLVDELTDQQRRLDRLAAGGDPHTDVTAVFSWSLRHLPASAARTFDRLGLHPGADFDPYAAAALADADHHEAARTLDLLARAHLIHVSTDGRYGMHDLLHAYASGRATADGPTEETSDAQGRLFDYYVGTAAAAMNRLHPSEAHRRPRVAPAATPTPDLPDLETARAWLDAELPNLVAMAAHTAQRGWPEHTVRLSRTLFRYLYAGHYYDAVAIHTHARRAARTTGDVAGEAYALLYLGSVRHQNGQYRLAAEHLQSAVALFRRADDPVGEACALANVGAIELRLGRYRPAARHLEDALVPFQRAGDERLNEASTRTILGAVRLRLGDHAGAENEVRQALTIFRGAGNQAGEAFALTYLGDIEQLSGRLTPAADHLHQALALCRQLGNRIGEAMALESLGTLHIRRADPETASVHLEQALAISRDIGDRDGESSALNGLGEATHAAGRPHEAAGHHTAALTLATDIGFRDQQARAHAGLGQAHHTLGDRTLAGQNYTRALSIYTELESPIAADVRARLATLDQPAVPELID